MKTHKTIVPLNHLTAADQAHSGGKAFNCARLKQAGFPVPDGVVVLASASEGDISTLPRHPWLDTIPADAVFAVRSSGIGEDGTGESFAGIHQTLLNVVREDLTAAVTSCRSSAHSLQALEYRRAMGMPTDSIQMGVLIQQMVQPTASGVAFSVNPVTGADDELVINSSWGLGELLVSGQVDPDEFVISKPDGALRWTRIGDKGNGSNEVASLTPAALRELATLVTDIERHYGSPQDIEWCYDSGRFWIVQSRPITTGRESEGETEWTRANLGEVMPDLTSPQAFVALENLLEAAERQYMGSLAAPEETLGPIVKSFHGRLYFNLAQLRRMCTIGGIAFADMLKSLGHAGAIQPSDEVAPGLSFQTLVNAPALLGLVRKHLRVAHVIREHDERTKAHLKYFCDTDPTKLSDERIWSAIERWFSDAPNYMQPVLLLGGVLFHESPVRKACQRVGMPFEQLVYPQLAVGERSVSAQQAFDLETLAEIARRDPAVKTCLTKATPDLGRMRVALRGTPFLAEFERFLEEYGHRGRYEYDWSLPRTHEDPSPLLQTIRVHLQDDTKGTEKTTEQREREAAEAWSAFEARLTWWQRKTLLPSVRKSIAQIKRYYVWREQVRSDLIRILAVLRGWHMVLAERFVERQWLDDRDDYFLLKYPEIAAIVRGQLGPESIRALVADRLAEQERLRPIQMPLLMKASQLPALIRTAGVSGGSEDEHTLTGQPVSRGCVEAEVVVVRDPGDFGRMKRGAILVAPATDPSWTPLFTLAAGVIVEVGGVLSHTSTVAREYGLPALANVQRATRRLRTGERVRLDANQGVIQRLASTPVVETIEVVEVG